MQKRRAVVCVWPARWQKSPFLAYCMAFNSSGAGVCLLTRLLTSRFRRQTDRPQQPGCYINPRSEPRPNMLWHPPVKMTEAQWDNEPTKRPEAHKAAVKLSWLLIFLFLPFCSQVTVVTLRFLTGASLRRRKVCVQLRHIQHSPFETPVSFKMSQSGAENINGRLNKW